MQLICEEHPQIKGRSVGLSMVIHHPEVSPEPLVRGESVLFILSPVASEDST